MGKKNKHFPQYFEKAHEAYAVGSISKTSNGRATLVEDHTPGKEVYLTVDYESHEAIKVKSGKTKKEYAAPYVAGNLNYHYKEGEKAKVVTIPIVMSGDLVKPNVGHPMSIPDEAHTRHIDKYGKTTLYQTYFRLDIATSNLNLVQDEETGVREGDRFLHAGTASAGCFTAVVDKTKDDERWNTIALVLMRARTMGSDRYIGTIQFDIPKKTYRKIEADVIAFGQQNKLAEYIWENGTHAVPALAGV